jgi:hypothetical protein
MEHSGRLVDVAALERDPLLRPKAGERNQDREHGEGGTELDADRLHVLDRVERGNLSPLRLRVRQQLRGVLVEKPQPDGVGEHLPERLVDCMR